MSHADGRKGECFDPTSTGGTATAYGVEVNTDEDRVLVFVSDGNPLLKGEEGVAIARHDDLELQLGEVVLEHAGNPEIVGSFGAVAARSAGITTAVAGVDDDCVKGIRRRDGRWAEDGINDLEKVGHGNVVASIDRGDRVAEDKLYVVHENLLRTGGELERDVLIFHLNTGAGLSEGGKFVEFLNLLERDVFYAFAILDFLPSILCSLRREGKEERDREDAESPERDFFKRPDH